MIRRLALALMFASGAAVAEDPPEGSRVFTPPPIVFDADHDPSPAVEEAIEALSEQQLEEARETGDSHVDTVVGEATASPPEEADEAAAPEAATGTAYGAPQPELAIQEPSAVVAPAYGDYGAPAARPGQDLGDLLAVLIREWSREPEIRQLAYGAASGTAAEPEAEPAQPPPPPSLAAAIDAGGALYARTLYEVNSDVGGPVIVEILEEPLAGAIATGGFEVVRDRMVLRLTALEHDGRLTAVDGWAVGLDCRCFGIQGAVDRHWFERVILPAAIAFAQSWATALARPDTTVRVEGDVVLQSTSRAASDERLLEGVAAATGQIGRVLTEDAPRAMTVSIPANTALAVTFATSPAIAAAGSAP